MKKVFTLTESELVGFIKNVLREFDEDPLEDTPEDPVVSAQTTPVNNEIPNINPNGLKYGDGGKNSTKKIPDVKQLQQTLIDKGYLKINKPTGYFGRKTRAALGCYNSGKKPEECVVTPVKKTTTPTDKKTTTTPVKKTTTPTDKKTTVTASAGCPVVSASSNIAGLQDLANIYSKGGYSDPWAYINKQINDYKKTFSAQGVPDRIACEIGAICVRPKYSRKNIIIVDTLQHVLYIFAAGNTANAILPKFVAKKSILSGSAKQSSDAKTIANAMVDWDGLVKQQGFKLQGGQYVDVTGKNRTFDEEMIYSNIPSNQKFLPKGIFVMGGARPAGDATYTGNQNANFFDLSTEGGKKLFQGIHGTYNTGNRVSMLQKANALLSNPTDPSLSKSFLSAVKNDYSVDLTQSFGCINVPADFLPTLQKYQSNAFVFNVGETNDNYLVDKGDEYLEKMMSSPDCENPANFGGELISSADATA